MAKFLLKMSGTDQNGKTIETLRTVHGDQKEIDRAAWEITQSWIKEGICNIHVVWVGEVLQSFDSSQN